MTQVKICGICDVAGAQAAVEAGANLIGFHFCDSVRRVTPQEAVAIIHALPARPGVVGVFIDQPPAEVEEIAEYCALDFIQLHGSEAPGYPAPRPLMKVLKVKDGVIPDVSQWPDPIMLDSWSADQRGGTGLAWEWSQAHPVLATRKVFIAGGLNPHNVADVVLGYRPYGVDVSSGVEAEPRRKDPSKVRAFVRAVREADTSD
jgi:phosphoribosylanthranilate isomerase